MEMNAEIKNQIVLAPPRRLGPLAKAEKTALETAADTREADLEVVERSRQKWGTAADAGFKSSRMCYFVVRDFWSWMRPIS
jgi:hypothetical protein